MNIDENYRKKLADLASGTEDLPKKDLAGLLLSNSTTLEQVKACLEKGDIDTAKLLLSCSSCELSGNENCEEDEKEDKEKGSKDKLEESKSGDNSSESEEEAKKDEVEETKKKMALSEHNVLESIDKVQEVIKLSSLADSTKLGLRKHLVSLQQLVIGE